MLGTLALSLTESAFSLSHSLAKDSTQTNDDKNTFAKARHSIRFSQFIQSQIVKCTVWRRPCAVRRPRPFVYKSNQIISQFRIDNKKLTDWWVEQQRWGIVMFMVDRQIVCQMCLLLFGFDKSRTISGENHSCACVLKRCFRDFRQSVLLSQIPPPKPSFRSSSSSSVTAARKEKGEGRKRDH